MHKLCCQHFNREFGWITAIGFGMSLHDHVGLIKKLKRLSVLSEHALGLSQILQHSEVCLSEQAALELTIL